MKNVIVIVLSFILSACANSLNTLSFGKDRAGSSAEYHKDSLHAHIAKLAEPLFLKGNRLELNETIAVGSFLPIEDLQGKDLPRGSSLGQQIQESMVTLATQAGMNVIEFKTTQTLKLENNLDIMLSRDLNKINKNIGIDYFLTGTYALNSNGLSINARLIDVSNSAVVAAATDVVPAYLAVGLAGSFNPKPSPIQNQRYQIK